MVELRNELNLFDSRLLKSVELDDMADRWSPQWRRSEASPDWNSDRIADRNDDVALFWPERQDEYRPTGRTGGPPPTTTPPNCARPEPPTGRRSATGSSTGAGRCSPDARRGSGRCLPGGRR